MIVVIAIGILVLVALIALVWVAPALLSKIKWRPIRQPRRASRSPDLPAAGDDFSDCTPFTRARIASMRWRAACQVLALIGAPRAPGFLSTYLTETGRPVDAVMKLARLLGAEPAQIHPKHRGDATARLAFLDTLEALCVLEDEMSSGLFPETYKAEIEALVGDRKFAPIQYLANVFAVLKLAKDSLTEVAAFGLDTSAATPGVAQLGRRINALSSELRRALPKAPGALIQTSMDLAEEARQWFWVADECQGITASLQDLLDWIEDNSIECDVSAIEDSIVGRTVRLLHEDMSLAAARALLRETRDLLMRNIERLGAPQPEPLEARNLTNVWRYFGFETMPARTAKDAAACKVAYHNLVAEHHPSQFNNAERKVECHEKMREISRNWQRASLYFGVEATFVAMNSSLNSHSNAAAA